VFKVIPGIAKRKKDNMPDFSYLNCSVTLEYSWTM